jgi:hypothetical protein
LNLPNKIVSRVRIASHTVDHLARDAPNAAQAADAYPTVKITNIMAAETMRLAAAAALAAASFKCSPTPGIVSAYLKQRTNTKTLAID